MPGECRLYFGLCLENAGCTLFHALRMQAVLWFMPGECRLCFVSCPENAGCTLVYATVSSAGATVREMQSVTWSRMKDAGTTFRKTQALT